MSPETREAKDVIELAVRRLADKIRAGVLPRTLDYSEVLDSLADELAAVGLVIPYNPKTGTWVGQDLNRNLQGHLEEFARTNPCPHAWNNEAPSEQTKG